MRPPTIIYISYKTSHSPKGNVILIRLMACSIEHYTCVESQEVCVLLLASGADLCGFMVAMSFTAIRRITVFLHFRK